MANGILYISCGVPGSGKSTYLKSHIKPDEKIISRDEIRFSLLKEGDEYFKYENTVFDTFIKEITENINAGINVYADATHLNIWSRIKLTDALLAAGCDPSAVYAICFDVPLDVCLERNEKRKGTKAYCPPKTIKKMFSNYTKPFYEFEKAWCVDEKGEVSILE